MKLLPEVIFFMEMSWNIWN